MSVNGEFNAPADLAQGKVSDRSLIWYGLCGDQKIQSSKETEEKFLGPVAPSVFPLVTSVAATKLQYVTAYVNVTRYLTEYF